MYSWWTTSYFNSRPREGANWKACDNLSGAYGFQFTPPRGGKPLYGDLSVLDFIISIHAPARGQTMTDGRISTASQFQFTPPRGGKPGERTKPPAPILISIHAPARGQTHTDGTYGLDLSDFNSRPREGANGVLLQRSRTRPEISIHAPARGQTGKRVTI